MQSNEDDRNGTASVDAANADETTDTRLATYGTLAPGRPNHYQLDGLNGRWLRGTIKGRLVAAGWGAALGYPALILDPGGPSVEVWLFESIDLPRHWPRLDEFEGSAYRRAATLVSTVDGPVSA